MKKRLTRIITLILSTLMLFSIGLTTLGCFEDQREKELNYMMNYMAKIPAEQTGYRISQVGKYPGDLLLLPTEGTFSIDGIDFEVVENTNNDAWYSIIVNGKTNTIDAQFMRERSQAFCKIQSMWYEYDNIKEKDRDYSEYKIEVGSVSISNNQIFFIVGNLEFNRRTYKGIYVQSLFLYDIKQDSVTYLGYNKDYHGETSFSVFLFHE